MDLDQFGAGCRHLLRIRENLGNPMISDEAFIADRRGVYADWTERPCAEFWEADLAAGIVFHPPEVAEAKS